MMYTKVKTRKSKFRKLISAILIVAISGMVYILSMGHILTREDELKKADVIVVLLGSIPDRILQAVDLYKDGYGDKIIMVETEKIGNEVLIEKNVNVALQEEINEAIALQLGVPEEDIIILEGNAKSTQDEAVKIRDFLSSKPEISSIMLVTSKSHSFRAAAIFEKALAKLDKEVRVISYPTKYDPFDPGKWYQDRNQIEQVIFETIKLLNFYLREQFWL
jgi:uncharacterized SAM-binding protein YcdF (DUF218 family)